MIIKTSLCLFLHKNMHCGYSLEASRRGASNEYLQCMFFMAKLSMKTAEIRCVFDDI